MINYSRRELQTQLTSDQVWSRVPAAASALLWPAAILFMGWEPGAWIGALSPVLLGVLSVVVAGKIRMPLMLADVLERLVRPPVWLLWLLVAWHLSVREPLFALLGQPALGGVLLALGLWIASLLLAFLSRSLARLAISRRGRDA